MLRPVQPYIEYILNQDYISEFLCLNKERPELQCNGKCYLIKQLKKQQEKDPLIPLAISLENYPLGFVTIFSINTLSCFSYHRKNKITFHQKTYAFNYNYSAFMPPDSL